MVIVKDSQLQILTELDRILAQHRSELQQVRVVADVLYIIT